MEQKKNDKDIKRLKCNERREIRQQSSSMHPSSTLNFVADQEALDDFLETEGRLSNGIFGEVFYGKIKSSQQPIVIKYNQRSFINNGECDVLKALQDKQYENFPKLYMKGKA